MRDLYFDEEVIRLLGDNLAGIEVHQDVEADDAIKSKAYLVYFGNDRLFGEASRMNSICGPTGDAYYHPFAIHVSATSPSLRNRIVAEVRKLLIGRSILASSAIRETGDGAGYGDTDNTLRPTRYTYYLTFQVMLDMGD